MAGHPTTADRAVPPDALRRRRVTAGPRPRDRSRPAPLSSSQLALWFLQQWAPDAPTFNAVRALRLEGALDAAALDAALATLVERHEALRTIVEAPGGGEPVQVILDPDGLDVAHVDLSGTPEEAREERLAGLLRALAREPFDLTVDRPMRATLVHLAPRDHVLLLRLHHVAGDASSMVVLMAELGELYDALLAGRPHGLADPPIQFADVAVWQRDRLRGRHLEELTAYWVGRLEGAPQLLPLPIDHERPAVQRHEGAHRRFVLPPELATSVDALARAESATLFMVGLAAFTTLLYRLSGEDDVVVGSPFANRTHAELAGVVGFLSNTAALRVRLAGNPSFREAVRRAREATLGALTHQEMPFELVVRALRIPREAGHNPLFQVNFRAQAAAPAVPRLTGLAVSQVPVDIGFSRFDLALELQAAAGDIVGYFEYDLDLFEPETVDGFVAGLRALLEQVVDDPDIPILAIALPAARRAPRRPGLRPGAPRGRRRADHPEAP